MILLHKLSLLYVILNSTFGTPVLRETSHENDECSNSEINQDTLRQVTVIMRHGERAPQDTYPNDPYINDPMKPYGWSQLTNEGRINQYNQGSFLRMRYDKFLGSTYDPDIFYLHCTAVDRTKMSAMLVAAALWKPQKEQTFKPDFPWQPVTLFYEQNSADTLMLIWDSCPKYAQMRSDILKLQDIREVQANNKQLYEELTNITGQTIATPDDINSLYNTLKAESDMNLTLPKRIAAYYPDKLLPLTLYDYGLNTYNDTFRKLKGGPFLKRIIDNMIARKEGTLKPETRRIFTYIGHDSTIVDLLNTMHIWNKQMPHFNIMFIIELHEDTNGWNVQTFLKNITTHEPYSLIIPGCTKACPLHKFVQILKPVIPDNWKEDCEVMGNYVPVSAPPP